MRPEYLRMSSTPSNDDSHREPDIPPEVPPDAPPAAPPHEPPVEPPPKPSASPRAPSRWRQVAFGVHARRAGWAALIACSAGLALAAAHVVTLSRSAPGAKELMQLRAATPSVLRVR